LGRWYWMAAVQVGDYLREAGGAEKFFKKKLVIPI
jgi:hypothetical protein